MGLAKTSWLNEDLLEKILRSAEKDRSIVVSEVFEVNPVASSGDYFLSEIHRLAVQYSRRIDGRTIEEKLSLIFKIAPDESSAYADFVTESDLFPTEIYVMSSVLPKMNERLKSMKFACSPRTYSVQYESPAYIVMEDLSPRGFRTSDLLAGLNLEHALLVVRNLAKFHASSVAVMDKEPNILEGRVYGMFHENMPVSGRAIVSNMLGNLIRETALWPELTENGIPAKVALKSENLFQKAYEAVRFHENEFNVLVHGDCWRNNLLFRYDEDGNPCEHVFVDFQFSYHGSAAADLLHFMAMSLSDHVRDNHRELLLREYHRALIETMSMLECTTKPPSFDELQRNMNDKFWFGIFIALTLWPTFSIAQSEYDTADSFDKGKDVTDHSSGVRSKIFRKFATKLLLDIDNRGLLDEL